MKSTPTNHSAGIVPWSIALLAILVFSAISGLASPASVSAQSDPAQQLADKYSPVLMLRQQKSNCDYNGEGYFPTTVDWLWNNPDVLLKWKGDGDAKADPVLETGPSTAELATASTNTYLDMPGDPRKPGCSYEQYFKARVAEFGLEPTVYAKIIYAPDDRRLYLEYWYYFYFNDWNDTHESDWEMLAIGFDAETPEAALALEPSWVGYAQHGGGETADWDDKKLTKEGDHPIAYLSAGSHATYYSSNMMIGWGEDGTAFGCDNTTAPSNAVHPNVVVIPDTVDPSGPFGWTLYKGRWGERQAAMFNGPNGPNMGNKWNDPALAFGNWRSTTLTVPGSSTLGLNTTDLFCSLSERGSRALVAFGSQPWSVAFIFTLILGLIGFAIWRVWSFFMEALDVYGNEIRTFFGIGVVAIPIGLLLNGFQVWAADAPPLKWMDQYFNGSDTGQLTQTLLVAVFQQVAMLLVVAPAIIFAMRDINRGIKPGVVESFKGSIRLLPRLVLPFAALFLMVVMLSWTVFLIPVVIYLLIRLQFFSHEVILDGERGFIPPLADSWNLTHKKFRSTFLLTIAFQVLGLVPGPLIGVIMMIVGGTNVKFANTVSSILYSVFVPLSVIGICLAYRRLKGEQVIEPHVRTRERDPKKAAEAESLREEAARRVASA